MRFLTGKTSRVSVKWALTFEETNSPWSQHQKMYQALVNWKESHQSDMVRHVFYQAMATPIMDLAVHHLRYSQEFPELHFGAHHMTVPARDIVAEIMVDWMVRLKGEFHVDCMNMVDIQVFQAGDRYEAENPTLREFL